MRTILRSSIAGLLLLSAGASHAATQPVAPQPAAPSSTVQQPIPIHDFLRNDSFDGIKLSPTGKYVARSVSLGEKTVLAISDRHTGKLTGHFNLAGKTQVLDFWWVNDERLLISVGEKFGDLEQPRPTGELYATNADGSGQDLLVGQRADAETHATHITTGKKKELVGADFLRVVPNSTSKVLVSVYDLQGDETTSALSNSSYARVEEMDVISGHRALVVRAPIRTAHFKVDQQGVVRLAEGADSDNASKTYYRDDAKTEWQLLNDQAVSHRVLVPLGFSTDGKTAFFRKDETDGPDGIYAYDTGTHAMKLQLRDPVSDPARIIQGPHHEVIGALYMDGKSKIVFFDEDSPLAKAYRSLEASFPDQTVVLEDFTSDGKIAMVNVYSDRSPGDYYLFDLDSKKAAHLASRYDWLDPDRMGAVRPITLSARDGVTLHGYLTLPPGSDGKSLPLIVNPHGGPFGVSDDPDFNHEVQLLASRGYAVLQINFRGSGGYGRAFEHSGYKQWGGSMQDDVTDATRWAIQQGIADAHRVCIYGASYGGYAALMGVAKEPSLYRCAIGYVGVYDMPTMYNAGDIQDRKSGENFLKDALGEQNLEAISPTHLADRITIPVMLVAGREDRRAPPRHTEMMRDALLHAGKKVDAKIYDAEGHGFFIDANRLDFYTRMLSFLDSNIGAGVTTGGGH